MRLRDTGVTGTILAAKAADGVDVDRVLASFDFGPPEATNDGWFICGQRPDVDPATNDFEGLIGAWAVRPSWSECCRMIGPT